MVLVMATRLGKRAAPVAHPDHGRLLVEVAEVPFSAVKWIKTQITTWWQAGVEIKPVIEALGITEIQWLVGLEASTMVDGHAKRGARPRKFSLPRRLVENNTCSNGVISYLGFIDQQMFKLFFLRDKLFPSGFLPTTYFVD